MFGRIAAFVLRWPRAVAIVHLVIIAVAIAAASTIRVDLSSRAFYGGRRAELAPLEDLVARWGPDDGTLAVVVQADEPLLARTSQAAIAELVGELRRSGLAAEVRAFVDHPLAAQAERSDRARTALMQPPVVPLLLAPDARTAVIAVELGFSSDDLDRTRDAVDGIAAIVERHRDARMSLALAGLPAIRAAFYGIVLGDQAVLVPACLGFILAVLAALHRSRHGVLVPAVLALVPTVVVLGIMAVTGEPIGLLSQGYLVLMPVIAVANAIHLVERAGELALAGAARHDLIVAACERIGLSALLTSATTAAGFASLLLAQMPMLRSFGAFAAIGVLVAWLVLLGLGPLLLLRARDLRPARSPTPAIGRALARMTTISRRRPLAIVALAILVGAAALAASRDIPVDSHLSDLIDPSHPVARADALVDRELGGVLTLELTWATAPGVFARDDVRDALDRFESWIATQPEVRAVVGPSTLARAAAATLPGQALAGPALALSGLRALVLDADASHARVRVHVPDLGAQAFMALEARIVAAAPTFAGAPVVATGTAATAYHGITRITDEMQASLLGVFVVVTLAIALALRDGVLGLAALLPNAIPLAVGYFAVGRWLGFLDPLAGVVLSIALGIAVDDTIHLIVRAREEAAAGATSTADAVARAIAGSGSACATTSAVLCGGLGLFGLSSFPPLRVLGTLGATVIATALVCDLWLLPAVLVLLRRPRV